MGVPLVHYSTNYVFDGSGRIPDDRSAGAAFRLWTLQVGRGRAHRRGGSVLCRPHRVIFGPKGASDLSKKSFVELMLDLSAPRDTIQAVADESTA